MKVSIILPCRNEDKYIERCLKSIIDTSYSKEELRVYVVDGFSTDRTRLIIKRIKKEHPFIKLIDNPDKITPIAVNLGLQADDSDIKILMGAHSTIDRDFISIAVEHLSRSPELGCVGGVISNVNENAKAEVIALAMSSKFGVGNARFRTGGKDGYVDTVAFGAYRKEVFEKIGYLDIDLVRNQDDELNFRLVKNGFKIWLTQAIKSNYYVRGDYKKLLKQYYQYGYWKVFVNKKHSTITSVRQLVPFFFVLFLLVNIVGSIFFEKVRLILLLGLSSYFVAAFYFGLQKTRRPLMLFRLIKVFLILHLGYGVGYFMGLLWFVLLRKKPSDKSKSLSR